MKKIIAMLLVVAMVFSFVGCGNSEPEETIAPVITAAPVQTQAPEETEAPTTAPQETETPQETTSPTYVLPDRVGSDEDEEDSSDKVINLSSKDDLANLTVDDDGDYSYKASESDVEDEGGSKSITFESETSGTVTIDVSEISEDVNVVIDMPNAHVETTVITAGTLTATTSATTLVLLDGSSVGTLVIEGGNVEIQAGSEVEINTYGTIASGSYIFLEAGGKIKGHETLNGAQTMDYAYNTEWAIDSWTNHADTSWYSQDLSTFEISTAEELAGVAKLVNDDAVTFADKTITITDDIDLGGKMWIPIASDLTGDYLWSNGRCFSGELDGGNFAISNMVSEHNGLFMTVVGATIKNLSLENVDITGDWYIAAIAGLVKDNAVSNTITTIDNCFVSGKVNARTAAGFVSNVTMSGTGSTLKISNSENSATIINTVNQKAAGFVNCLNNGILEITNCVNKGYISNIVSGDHATSGGFIGYIGGGELTFTNCINEGFIEAVAESTGKYSRAGGIAGISRTYEHTYINCENKGNIYASSDTAVGAGGIIGEWQDVINVINAISAGNVTGEHTGTSGNLDVGGITGRVNDVDGGIITNSIIGDIDLKADYINDNVTVCIGAISARINDKDKGEIEISGFDNNSNIATLVGGNTSSFTTLSTTINLGDDYKWVIPAGSVVTIDYTTTLYVIEGATLIIEEGATFTNNGTLVIYGTVVGEEYITGDGSITQS